jgi:hypothetical protein
MLADVLGNQALKKLSPRGRQRSALLQDLSEYSFLAERPNVECSNQSRLLYEAVLKGQDAEKQIVVALRS